MKRGELINGFQYLIMLSLKKMRVAGVGSVRQELIDATGETVTYGGVSSTMTTLEKNGDIERVISKTVPGQTRRIDKYKLSDSGANRLEKMNRAVWSLLPAQLKNQN
jgi:hypothetical protein